MVVYVDVGGSPKRNSLEAALGYVDCALIDVRAEKERHKAAHSDTPEWFMLHAMDRDLTVIRKNLLKWEEERRAADADSSQGSGG